MIIPHQVIRSQLAISRDMPFLKVVRSPDEDAKGVKPIIVTFEKLTVICEDCEEDVDNNISGQKCRASEVQDTERESYCH